MADDWERVVDDGNARYLPERYRQAIKTKQRRRYIRKILVSFAIIVVMAVFCMVFLGNFYGVLPAPAKIIPDAPEVQTIPAPHDTAGNSSSYPSNTTAGSPTVSITPEIALGSGMQTRNESGILSMDTAVDLIYSEFPRPAYTISSINLTTQSGQSLYEFRILHPAVAGASESRVVYIDAVDGEPYSPGQETATITAEQAKRFAMKSFPTMKPDRVRARYTNPPDTPHTWDFTLVRENTTILTGSLDPDTGQILSYTGKTPLSGRPKAPVISLAAAQKIADRAIAGWNGQLPLNMSTGEYEAFREAGETVAGRYVLEYQRIVQDWPCDEDGFTISVDAVTGEVTGYQRRWSSPENAFAVASEPLVTKREATFAILQKAKEIFPESIGSVRILSARVQWKDRHAPGTTPRPGSIPLAWTVTFDDNGIRAGQPARPATGWVDARTGIVLGMDYRH